MRWRIFPELLVPSPKFQLQLLMLPVDSSVNATVGVRYQLVGVAPNLAASAVDGAVTVMVLVAVALLPAELLAIRVTV